MRGEPLEIENLCARAGERAEKAALAAARRTVHHGELERARHCRQFRYDPAPVGAVAAGKSLGRPADFAQDVRHRARALAAAPAVDERSPALIFPAEKRVDVARHILCHERGAELFRLEGRHALVERADLGALGVVEHRRGNRAGNMVERIFRGRARVDHRVIFLEIHRQLI